MTIERRLTPNGWEITEPKKEEGDHDTTSSSTGRSADSVGPGSGVAGLGGDECSPGSGYTDGSSNPGAGGIADRVGSGIRALGKSLVTRARGSRRARNT